MKNGLIILAVVVLVGGVAFWRNRCPCCEVVESGDVVLTQVDSTSAAPPKPAVAERIQQPAQDDAPVAPGTLCPEPPPTAAVIPPATQSATVVEPSAPAVPGAEQPSPAAPATQAAPAPAAAPSTPDGARLPRVVDLGAGKCKACKDLAPILEELKKEYAGRVDVEFIDVWKNKSAGEPYRIRVIPTQVFFDRDGQEVWRHEGFLPKADFIAKFAELGVK